jgi:hypothetical protein
LIAKFGNRVVVAIPLAVFATALDLYWFHEVGIVLGLGCGVSLALLPIIFINS